MKTFTLTITEAHLAKAEKAVDNMHICSTCTVAQALRDRFPKAKSVSAGYTTCYIDGQSYEAINSKAEADCELITKSSYGMMLKSGYSHKVYAHLLPMKIRFKINKA